MELLVPVTAIGSKSRIRIFSELMDDPKGTEFFDDPEKTSIELQGKILEFNTTSVMREITTVELTLELSDFEFERDNPPKYQVIMINPKSAVVIREFRETNFKLKEGGRVGTCSFTAILEGLFNSYEDACAYLMQKKIEESTEGEREEELTQSEFHYGHDVPF